MCRTVRNVQCAPLCRPSNRITAALKWLEVPGTMRSGVYTELNQINMSGHLCTNSKSRFKLTFK